MANAKFTPTSKKYWEKAIEQYGTIFVQQDGNISRTELAAEFRYQQGQKVYPKVENMYARLDAEIVKTIDPKNVHESILKLMEKQTSERAKVKSAEAVKKASADRDNVVTLDGDEEKKAPDFEFATVEDFATEIASAIEAGKTLDELIDEFAGKGKAGDKNLTKTLIKELYGKATKEV